MWGGDGECLAPWPGATGGGRGLAARRGRELGSGNPRYRVLALGGGRFKTQGGEERHGPGRGTWAHDGLFSGVLFRPGPCKNDP